MSKVINLFSEVISYLMLNISSPISILLLTLQFNNCILWLMNSLNKYKIAMNIPGSNIISKVRMPGLRMKGECICTWIRMHG